MRSTPERDQWLIDQDNPSERVFDALDHLRDEAKERDLEKCAADRRHVDLCTMFDLAIANHVGTLYLHESTTPGATKALRYWADSRGHVAADEVRVTTHRAPYVDLVVYIRRGAIAVLVYRDATATECEGMVQP